MTIEKIAKFLSASKFTKGFEKYMDEQYEGAIALEGILHKYNMELSDLSMRDQKKAQEIVKKLIMNSADKRELSKIENNLESYNR